MGTRHKSKASWTQIGHKFQSLDSDLTGKMKLVHSFFFMAIVAMVAVDGSRRPDIEYRSQNKIIHVQEDMTYSEAEAYCREKGMELITFKTGNIYNRFKEYGIF